MEKKGYRVLVDLDSILDTRLGTIALLSQEAAKALGPSKEYISRETDIFSTLDSRIDDVEFRDRYLKRNEDTLKCSVITDIPYQLGISVKNLTHHVDNGLMGGIIEIVVNTYPYRLSEEVRDLLRLAMQQFIPMPGNVTIEYIDVYALSPSLIKSRYDEWYAYHIDEWLSIHQQSILTSIMKPVLVTLPRLSTTGVIPDSPDVDPFSAKELIFSTYFRLIHISASYYSYNHVMTEHIYG